MNIIELINNNFNGNSGFLRVSSFPTDKGFKIELNLTDMVVVDSEIVESLQPKKLLSETIPLNKKNEALLLAEKLHNKLLDNLIYIESKNLEINEPLQWIE